ASRATATHYKRSDRHTLSLLQPQPAPSPPGRLRHRLQLRPSSQDPERPFPLRIHLQYLDKRVRMIHSQSDPSNAGTKHLDRGRLYGCPEGARSLAVSAERRYQLCGRRIALAALGAERDWDV